MDAVTEARKLLEKRHDELRNAKASLDSELSNVAAALAALGTEIKATGRRAAGGPAKPSSRKRKRAPRGQNQDKIIAHLKANPGTKAADVARATGIAGPTVYTTISKLTKAGKIKKGKNGLTAV